MKWMRGIKAKATTRKGESKGPKGGGGLTTLPGSKRAQSEPEKKKDKERIWRLVHGINNGKTRDMEQDRRERESVRWERKRRDHGPGREGGGN